MLKTVPHSKVLCLEMKVNAERSHEIVLANRGVYTLAREPSSIRVRCLEGNLWITQEGDLDDYILTPGQELSVRRPGKLVMQGIPAARASLSLLEREIN